MKLGFSQTYNHSIKTILSKVKTESRKLSGLSKFSNNEFRAELDNKMLKYDLGNMEYQHFLNIFTEILNKHAPTKQKYLRDL